MVEETQDLMLALPKRRRRQMCCRFYAQAVSAVGFPYLPERYELTPTYADAAHFYAAVVDRTAARWPDETKAIMLEGENDARRKS